MMTQTDTQEVQRYLELLYPDPPDDTWLVVSWIAAKGQWCSRWFRFQSEDAAAFISKQAWRYNVYTGVGLRHPDCTPAADKRGESPDVSALPGLWIELDHNAGVHTAKNLTTPQELLAFIEELPFRFSLLVDSTGGYHGYVLFKEAWSLDTPAERDAAALLLRRFQRTIQAKAAAQGWKVDSTADLARVLRPASTLNHKTQPPKPVTILHEDAIRYNPSDIADAPWLATIEDVYTPSTGNGDFPPTQIEPIVAGCPWLKHCLDDAATLPEPEWYGMLGIVGRCDDGGQIAHEWSTPYPLYSKDETAKKLKHALDHGPLTCSTIRYDKGGEEYCRGCQHWGKVKSPVVLGMTVATSTRLSSFSSAAPAHSADPHKIRPSGLSSLSSLSSYPEWPTLASDALYGLAGEFVRTIAPHSESDPIALLIQFLAYFGVIIGRSAYYQVEATKHYANLNSCLVGPTSKGRKGTAYDHIERIMQTVDTSWTLSNVSGGCGSGEGLIAAVRDKTMKREPIKVRGRVTGYEEVETDPGVIDKRLLVYEAEFSSVLKIAGREGNILSEILRKAWETGNLRNTVKNNPLKATGAHIAIIGHITIEEVQRTLTTTDAANGFGNRFLWLCVRRSKLLPDGGELHTVDFDPLLKRLREAFSKAKDIQQMQRDDAAKAAWHAVYPSLSEERPGLVGSLLGRAEAQVLRLSMLYALLEGTNTIQAEHLYAALALWEYAEASVTYIFGKSMGDPIADTLLTALQDCYPQGLGRKHILEETFQRNIRADQLDRVLELLHRRNLITLTDVPPEGVRGRHKQVVTFRLNELNELNELNRGGYLSISKDAVKSHRLSSYMDEQLYELNPAGPSACVHTQTMQTANAVVCQACGVPIGEVL